MKPITIICQCLLLTTVALGQGSVFFRNKILGQAGGVDVPFFDDQGVPLEGSNYVAQLYAWNAGDGFQPVGAPVPFATNGYFYGAEVVVPFVQGCSPAWVQVLAWEAQGGTTFDQAALAGAWTGVSAVLFLPETGSPSRPEACPEARLGGLQYPGSPLVVRQPQAQTILAGERSILSVIASSGVSMSYQWHQQPSDRPDGLIAGATNATYTSSALFTNTTFWVSVANSAGSVLSDKATVTVVATAPRLALQLRTGLPMLTLEGPVGATYRIEFSTNLSATNWTSLVELSLSATPFTFSDSGWSNSPARFYRAIAP